MDRPIYLDMLAEQKKRICQLGVDFENFQAREIQEREDILYEHQEEYGGTNKVVNQITPLVSVCIPTYQHVEYIEQCLQGAIMQKTSFPIEIIIGDDGSVDGTVEICKKYADKYPDKIRFYDRARVLTRIFDNEGHIICACNWWWTIRDARGKYIALCEGDDYWTDPLKLQKQIDFLENHPDYVYSCHRYDILNTQTHEYNLAVNVFFDQHPDLESFSFDINYPFFTEWITKTLTSVYRRSAAIVSSSSYKYMRDVHNIYFILKQGKGICHSFVGGVYRISPAGIFSMSSNIEKANMAYKIHEELYEKTHDVMFRKLMLGDFTRRIYFSRRPVSPRNLLDLQCYFYYLPLLLFRKCFKALKAKFLRK